MSDELVEEDHGRSHLFQIREDDLADLERIVPELCDRLTCAPSLLDARMKTRIRRVKQIISDIRWDYGPPDQVEIIPA